MNRRLLRKLTNLVALGLSGLATAVGLFFLGAILWTLVSRGLAGMSWALFTAMTPPPGSSGGLLNAIYGSVVMTVIGSSSADRSACWPAPTWPSTGAPPR